MLEHRLMRRLLYTSLNEEDIIKRDSKIYKTKHFLLKKKKKYIYIYIYIYMLKYTVYMCIFKAWWSIQLPSDPLQETAPLLKCDKYHTTLVFSACLKANC